MIAKQMPQSRLLVDNIDELFDKLSKIECVHVPLMNVDGKYSLLIDDKILFLYSELEEINAPPSGIWWAECLADIHKTLEEKKSLKSFSNNFYDETISLLTSADKYIEKRYQYEIHNMLKTIDLKKIKEQSIFALCHQDPYILNVMRKEEDYKIIDLECMGLSPKEYDMQRLLYNYAIDENDELKVIEFWNMFKNKYENKTNDIIDIELLKNIYKLDFIRSMSWLYIVSNDLHRSDRDRQKKVLNAYKESIDNNIHTKVLKKIY